MRNWFVYILCNWSRTTLYIGITNDLTRRIIEHREGQIHGFTSNYKIKYLLHYETYNDPMSAICREKQLKGWVRRKKEELISLNNPTWRDLSSDWEIPNVR